MRATDPLARSLLIATAGALVFVATALAPAPPDEIRVAPFDRFAEAIRDGQVPFRDFTVEYPPGSIPAVVAPLALPFSYETSFRVVQALCGALLVLAVAALLRTAPLRRQLAAVALVALLPVLLGPVVVARYDLVPAALVAWALVALEAARVRVTGALLGTAIAAKLYPLAVVPAFAAHASALLHRPARRLLLPLVAALGAVAVGFVALAPGGVAYGLSRQLGRGLQLETVGSSAVLAARWLGAASPGVVFTSGSQTLTGQAAQAVSVALTVVGLGVVVALATAVWRLRDRDVDVRLASAALVALVVVCSKVLSPQFLVWLVPLALVVETRRWGWIAALLAVACVLTRMIYPARYEELVAFEPGAVALLVVRNALLVAAAWLLVAELARRLLGTGALRPAAPVPSVARPAG